MAHISMEMETNRKHKYQIGKIAVNMIWFINLELLIWMLLKCNKKLKQKHFFSYKIQEKFKNVLQGSKVISVIFLDRWEYFTNVQKNKGPSLVERSTWLEK